MKKNLLFTFCGLFISAFGANAQVTQINSNKSLQVIVPLAGNKTILTSEIDSSIWVTDGTLAGTVQISTIKFIDDWSLLNGKLIFAGNTSANGTELYITDGTSAGTVLVKDINTGAPNSDPSEFVLLNGYLYFTAETTAAGRELWRTNGTAAGTTLVKDIVAGPTSSNTQYNYNLFSNGSFLLLSVNTAAAGNELWKSDGTSAGTALLKDINPGADSSNPSYFTPLNGTILFTATDATHGNELWKTDGTAGGTVLLKDINVGPGSSTAFEYFPGFGFNIFLGFHMFNNKAYFNADDGNSTGEIWVTDGTTTSLVKDLTNDPAGLAFPLISDAVNLPTKFIFPFTDGTTRSELWQSDGTPGGTSLFKAFAADQIPVIFLPYSVDFVNLTFSQPLFQGNKFFFGAGTAAQGYELWISDGTLANTTIVKDIFPGTGDGIDFNTNISYLYTTTTFFFAGTDGTHGNELWQSDGTSANTSMVADIYTNAGDANPELAFFVSNGKVLFTATNGDDPDHTDLYVVGGTFVPLPIRLLDFTVTQKNSDALLTWSTSQELNTKNFTVQRSYDGQKFEDIGTVQAMGTSYNVHAYAFTDAGIINSGKNVVYYRLLATDIDGKSVNTNIISLKIRGNKQWDVKMLSNPVRGNVRVVLTGITGNLQLSIHDINGKTIYTKSLDNINGEITLPAVLQSGMYILEAVSNNEKRSIRFIK